ncbi:contractile injection system protein, VgrG/Pvc8 family, partial [Rickettsiales bacterium]|nr:contractile injection system protein, VgrG/Pvc8 family [Rickettsiales bacterium]
RLISLNITDETGLVSDKAEILLDNRDSILEIPATGANLEISIGYEGKELNLMGSYIVDTIELMSPPLKMRVTAKATNTKIKNLNSKIRSPKSKSWNKNSLIGIIEFIAKDHEFEAVIDKEFDQIFIKHIDQTDESDISFLSRLARDHDAFIKFIDDKLIFIKKGTGTSISGVELPEAEIFESEITNWNLSISERGKFGRVRVKWHDLSDGKEKTVSHGNEEPTYGARYVFATQDRADQVAKAKLAEFQRGIKKLSISAAGNPTLSAESKITIPDVKYLQDQTWIINNATHNISDSGYTTQITALLKL